MQRLLLSSADWSSLILQSDRLPMSVTWKNRRSAEPASTELPQEQKLPQLQAALRLYHGVFFDTQPGWVDIDMDGNVTVDGQTLDEPYLTEKALGNCDIDLPHQVSEAHWFLMGDNRDTSVDSRSIAIGDISKDQIEGQIIFRIWPLNKIGSIQ